MRVESCLFPSMPYSCRVPALQCAGWQPTWGEGGTPHWARPCLPRALPARSTACRELSGADGVLAGEGVHYWGSGIEPQSLHPHREIRCCVRGSPSPMASHHAQAELPKAGPLGMVGVKPAVARSCPGWSRCRLCPVVLCLCGQCCGHPLTAASQQLMVSSLGSSSPTLNHYEILQ